MERYRHTQIGYFLLVALGGALALILYLMLITGFNWVSVIVLIILAGCLWIFASLTVTLDDDKLEIWFGPGFIRKSFLLSEIVAHRVVTNPWYYGWGIKLIPGGWLFNVSGLRAVELQMVNGKRYRIGTDDAEGLALAIEETRRSGSA
jgi:hypothetical protein